MNTQDQAAQQSEQANAEEKIKFGAPTMSNGLHHLWEVAADHLSDQQLAFFAEFVDEAERESGNLARVVMDIGCLVCSDKNSGNFQSQDSTSTLLFSLSHQIDVINGMLQIGTSAAHRIERPELYKKAK